MTRDELIERLAKVIHRNVHAVIDYGCPLIEDEDKAAAAVLAEIEALGLVIVPEVIHASDCAIYNAPALPVGPCDCAALSPSRMEPKDE